MVISEGEDGGGHHQGRGENSSYQRRGQKWYLSGERAKAMAIRGRGRRWWPSDKRSKVVVIRGGATVIVIR